MPYQNLDNGRAELCTRNRFCIAFTALALLILMFAAGNARATDLTATPATFSSVLNSAQPGDRVLLASGDYGTFTGAAKSSPGVTIKPQTGATASLSLQFRVNPTPSWLTLDGLTITGGDISGGTHDVTIKNSAFTSTTVINPGPGPSQNNTCGSCPQMSNANIQIGPANTFNNIDPGTGYEGRIQLLNTGSGTTGLTIDGNTFNDGTSDGIQASTGNGAFTISNNQFTNIIDCRDEGCQNGPHTDALQLTDVGNVTVEGNYFDNDTHGIVAFDGLRSGNRFDDNVFDKIGIATNYWGIVLGGSASPTLTHNTFRTLGPNFTSKAGQTTTNITWRDNVSPDGPVLSNGIGGNATVAQSDWNLCANGCPGTHSITGSPTFTGGTNPADYQGFQLAFGSPGRSAASDGLDMGARINASPPPPAQCADGTDNDSDGLTDYPADPGCSSSSDNDETDAPTDHTPVAVFTASPEPSTVGQTVTFDASGSTCQDTPCTYHWHDIGSDGLGDWPLGPDGQTMTFAFQGVGTKYVELVLTDADGDVARVEHDHVVNAADTTPPDTTITSGPASSTTSTSADFSFTATETGSTFECKLDAGAYASCSSPKSYTGLAVGSHTFTVRATDQAGNTDQSPASQTWTITAPASPPTFVQEAETAWTRTTATTRSVTFSANAGDVLIAYGGAEDQPVGVSISGGSGVTWTERQQVNAAGYSRAYVWTGTVASTGSKTVTFTKSTGSNYAFGGDVLTFRNSSGVGASAKANGTGAPSLGITTTASSSAIVKFNADWNAVDGAARNSLTAGVGAFTEQTYQLVSGAFTVYGGYHANAGTAGAKTVGYSAPSGQAYAIVAVEVKP